ncbi:MAG: dienelactone hydrolase family protein [Novosphingobium sp.]
MQKSEASFPRGDCPIYSFGPDDRSAPMVLFFPDAFGQRPASFAVAEEIATSGWRVMMPDYFYDHRPYAPLTPKSLFEEGPERDRLMQMFKSVTMAKVDEDAAALISLAESQSDAGVPFATVGYCMGGRYALSAITGSERVKFAGAFHASNIAPAEGDSPHLRFAGVKGRIYVGVAGIDPTYGAEEHGRLAQALREADVDHVIESYHGMGHGWVYPDLSIYNEKGARKHMARIKEHFAEVIKG